MKVFTEKPIGTVEIGESHERNNGENINKTEPKPIEILAKHR